MQLLVEHPIRNGPFIHSNDPAMMEKAVRIHKIEKKKKFERSRAEVLWCAWAHSVVSARGHRGTRLVGRVPCQIGVVTQFPKGKSQSPPRTERKKAQLSVPWPDQISNGEQSSQQDTDSADNNVRDPHEGILATKSRPCGEQD